MQFVPWKAFSWIVARYDGDLRVRSLNCAQQYRAMAFAQLTRRKSLRALTACLGAVPVKVFHAGFTAPIHVSMLARANGRRSWQIHAEPAQRMIARARALAATPLAGRVPCAAAAAPDREKNVLRGED